MATARAANPREAMAEQSAVEVPAELPFDEQRIAFTVQAPGLGQEGLEVLAHHLVQHALLGLAALIAGGQGSRGRARVAFVGVGGQRRTCGTCARSGCGRLGG
jgi:hypothetical protein